MGLLSGRDEKKAIRAELYKLNVYGTSFEDQRIPNSRLTRRTYPTRERLVLQTPQGHP